MVEATLLKKLAPDGQLGIVAKEYPTVLFTCIGFDGFHHTYIDQLKGKISLTACSAVVLFERYHCKAFKIIVNDESPHSLTEKELRIVEQGLRKHIPSDYLGRH